MQCGKYGAAAKTLCRKIAFLVPQTRRRIHFHLVRRLIARGRSRRKAISGVSADLAWRRSETVARRTFGISAAFGRAAKHTGKKEIVLCVLSEFP
jgi:hypothetical protein